MVAFCGTGQDYAKGGAMSSFGLMLDQAAMLVDNARRDGKAQPGACRFGGKERIEEPPGRLKGNAFAGIGHFEGAGGHARLAGLGAQVMDPPRGV